jgi:hypothetical protein
LAHNEFIKTLELLIEKVATKCFGYNLNKYKYKKVNAFSRPLMTFNFDSVFAYNV